jgi:succinate dehydrogenase/fumarate reductase iron-sulfur protein
MPTAPREKVEGPATVTKMRRFKVFRYKRGDAESRFDDFDVPVGPRTSVLDALRWIEVHADRTLAIRHSCFHASCGTCGLRINGREGLACVTFVGDLGRTITVEPEANMPILADLVLDMREFYARSARASSCPARSRPTASTDSSGSRIASSAACACRRARSPRRRTNTSGRRRSRRHSD